MVLRLSRGFFIDSIKSMTVALDDRMMVSTFFLASSVIYTHKKIQSVAIQYNFK